MVLLFFLYHNGQPLLDHNCLTLRGTNIKRKEKEGGFCVRSTSIYWLFENKEVYATLSFVHNSTIGRTLVKSSKSTQLQIQKHENPSQHKVPGTKTSILHQDILKQSYMHSFIQHYRWFIIFMNTIFYDRLVLGWSILV